MSNAKPCEFNQRETSRPARLRASTNGVRRIVAGWTFVAALGSSAAFADRLSTPLIIVPANGYLVCVASNPGRRPIDLKITWASPEGHEIASSSVTIAPGASSEVIGLGTGNARCQFDFARTRATVVGIGYAGDQDFNIGLGVPAQEIEQ